MVHAPCFGEVLSGRVLDVESGAPAPGIAVYLTGNRIGGATGGDGRFTLEAPRAGRDTLRVRGIGYRERILPVTVPGSVTVRLKPEPAVMDTVKAVAVAPDDLPAHARTSSSVTVIAKEDIPERAATVEEVLDRETGVDIRSLGGVGARSEISIRGSTSDQVSVYVDGIPISAEGSGFNGLSFVPMNRVERIEVYRGSSPGAFGSGAIGGIVNVTTDASENGFGADASMSYGSFGTAHQAFMARGGNDLGRFLVSAGRNASDNDFRYFNDRGTTIDTSDDGWDRRKNSDYEAWNLLARWDSDLVNGHGFSVKANLTDSKRGVSGLGRKPALSARMSNDGLLVQARHRYRGLFDTHIWHMRQRAGLYDPMDEAGRRGRQDTDDRITVDGVSTRMKNILGPAILHTNIELKREKFDSSDAFDEAVIPASYRTTGGAGVEAEVMFAGGDLWITPRIHASAVRDRIHNASLFLAQSVYDTVTSVDRSTLTYALGLRYRAHPSLTLRANAGVFPRLPEFGELFGDTGDVVGNTRLEEERGTNLDAGAHYSSGKGAFDLDAAVFHRYARDLIQTRNYGDYLISENIGKAAITGVETWAAMNLPDRKLSCRVTLTYQDAKNRSDETLFRKQRYYGKFLPYHPEWKGGVRLGAPVWKRVRATWKTDWESECFKGPSNLPDEKLDAKVIHSLGFRFDLPGRVGVSAEAENLTDVHAQDRWGYPKPGRGYYLTLSWDWERSGD